MAYKFRELAIFDISQVTESPDLYMKILTPYSEIKYTLSDDGTYYTCGVGENGNPFLVLRENTVKTSIDGIPVTHIGDWAFYYANFYDFIVPEGITDIGDYAFAKTFNLRNITLPNSLLHIGHKAFWCCTVESIELPNNLKSIGNYAFCDSNLKSIVIPDSVTSIEDSTFALCRSLERAVIGSGVTSIGADAFSECESLTSITIPDNVNSIGDFAFIGDYELKSVTIGNRVTHIGRQVFDGCHKLADVYYNGTEAEWAKIDIGTLNEKLLNATIHFASEPEVQTITFTIDGTTYEADAGMTWAKWLASEYNTDGYFIDRHNTGAIFYTVNHIVIDGSNTAVTGGSSITDGYQYKLLWNSNVAYANHYWAIDHPDVTTDLDIYMMFSSNGASYYSISVVNGKILYSGTLVYTQSDGWVDNAYRSVYIPEDTPLTESQKAWADRTAFLCYRLVMSELTAGESTAYYYANYHNWDTFIASPQNKDNIFSIKEDKDGTKYVLYRNSPVYSVYGHNELGENITQKVTAYLYMDAQETYYYNVHETFEEDDSIERLGFLHPGTFTFDPFFYDLDTWIPEDGIYDPAKSTFWFNFTSAGLPWSGMWINAEEMEIYYQSDFDGSGWHLMFAGTWKNDSVKTFELSEISPHLPAKFIYYVLTHTTYSGDYATGGSIFGVTEGN